MFRVATFLLTLGIAFVPAHADTLAVDGMEKKSIASTKSGSRPTNGLDKRTVEARFGAPQSTHAPVGDPPISRWDYPGYSVYFEYDKVLTSVIHRKPTR